MTMSTGSVQDERKPSKCCPACGSGDGRLPDSEIPEDSTGRRETVPKVEDDIPRHASDLIPFMKDERKEMVKMIKARDCVLLATVFVSVVCYVTIGILAATMPQNLQSRVACQSR